MIDHYRNISRSYNWLSRVYSLGAVAACRGFALEQLSAGVKVCFLAVGEGEEAVEAVKMGAKVTVVDRSEAMLARFKQVLLALDSSSRASVEVYCGDVYDFCDEHGAEFEQVVCHFFLNVFSPEEMPRMLEKVHGLITQGGSLVIGDFWYDKTESLYIRSMQVAYWNVALFIFKKIVKNANHPIYIYDSLLEGLGLNIKREQTYRVLGIPMYRSVVAKRLG